MQIYTSQPAVVETQTVHPILTLIGVVIAILVIYWILSSLGAKKGKKVSPKAAKSAKKGVQPST